MFWNAIWMSIFNQYRIVESLGRGIQAGSSVVLHGNEKVLVGTHKSPGSSTSPWEHLRAYKKPPPHPPSPKSMPPSFRWVVPVSQVPVLVYQFPSTAIDGTSPK